MQIFNYFKTLLNGFFFSRIVWIKSAYKKIQKIKIIAQIFFFNIQKTKQNEYEYERHFLGFWLQKIKIKFNPSDVVNIPTILETLL